MSTTYPLGSIPPLSAWQGETLTFKVTSSLGDGVKFSKRAMPRPQGKIALDANTGVFTYQPSADDKDQFAVWIRARKGSKDDKPQKIYITPHPSVDSEFAVIQHVSKEPPDKASTFFTTFSQEDAGEDYFNRSALPGDQPIMTKKVSIAGVSLVFEEGREEDDDESLYQRLRGRSDIRQLIICADEVVIGCELKLPGTDVHIYARELRFEDRNGKIARIETTPLPITGRATAAAMKGQKGGDVYLFVQRLITPGTAKRIIASGGKGQPGAQGKPGSNGTSVPPWNGKVTVEGKEFDFSDKFKDDFEKFKNHREELEQGKPIKVRVTQQVRIHQEEFRFWWPADVAPTDGKEGDSPRGPGAGGDGGSVYARFGVGIHDVPDVIAGSFSGEAIRFKEQLNSRVNLSAGEVGEPADDVKGTVEGKPNPGLIYNFVYTQGLTEPNRVSFSLANWVKTQPGKALAAPRTTPIQSKPGQILPLQSKAGWYYWLQPTTVRAVIAYSDAAFLAGHLKEASELLSDYLTAVKGAAAADASEAAWPLLQDELATMLQRVTGQYDYFGNPAGWVPMLSFQANYTLFEKEIEDAVPAMFLAYWIEHTANRARTAAGAMAAAIKRLHAENDRAFGDLRAAELKVATLQGEMVSIVEQLEATRKLVEGMKETLTKAAKDKLQVEHLLRSSAKIIGGVMQLIPVGQPVLGSLGKAAVVLSDIDLDDPTKSLAGVAGAFTPIATEKLGPAMADKAKDLFAKLMPEKQLALTEKETKAKEKQAEFDAEVAKEELEKKVKAHLEKKEEAKNSILKGFSDYAVSEDDLKKRLEKVLAQTPEYRDVVKEVERLNEQKRDFTERLFATVQAIDIATTTILNNQLSILQLHGQRVAQLDQLNLEALQSVQDMGRKARERLLLYQYYLLKSYHYLMLDTMPGEDFQSQTLFDEFKVLLTKSDGMLKPDEFKALSKLFRGQLAEMATKIITWYQGSTGKKETYFFVTLTQQQIETLNSDEKRVKVDLLWELDGQREDIRITSIETNGDLVKVSRPSTNKSFVINLDYVHDGVSKLRRDGRLYLFRSGRYGVDSAATGGSQANPRTDIHWGSTLDYNPAREEKLRLTVEPSKADAEEESLVRHLIGASSDAKSPMKSFRPGAWTQLAIQRSGSEAAKIESLTLKVNYVYIPVNIDKYSTITVKVADDAQPYILCDAVDENNSSDGQGGFVRTFKKSKRQVTLTAPANYGQRAFLGWRTGQAVRDGGPILDPDPGRSLELKLHTSDYLIEPVYAPDTTTPVDDKGDDWPKCPPDWAFDDWMFVNDTKAELTINKIVIDLKNTQVTAAVDQPQGGLKVKLSFERLKLLPGDETKLSVCLNPNAPRGLYKTGFGWHSGGEDYYAGFTVEGKPWDFKKGAAPASDLFNVDQENRILTFARA